VDGAAHIHDETLSGPPDFGELFGGSSTPAALDTWRRLRRTRGQPVHTTVGVRDCTCRSNITLSQRERINRSAVRSDMVGLVQILRGIEETDPRGIATVDPLDFEVEFVRDDIGDTHSDAELDNAYRRVMGNQVSADDFRNLIDADRFDAQTLFFDDIVVFLFPSERYEGVFASFDRTHPFPVDEILDVATDVQP
jgi:hypothetical protein